MSTYCDEDIRNELGERVLYHMKSQAIEAIISRLFPPLIVIESDLL